MLNCEGWEIGTGCSMFLMYRVSPDSKDLWANKHILNSILALMGRKCSSITLRVTLSVLYLGMFTMIPSAAFRIIWRSCKSVFDSPYNKALQKSICVRIKPCASFSLNSLSINFDIFAIFRWPSIAFFLLQQLVTWELNFHQKQHVDILVSLTDLYQFDPALNSKEDQCFSFEGDYQLPLCYCYPYSISVFF